MQHPKDWLDSHSNFAIYYAGRNLSAHNVFCRNVTPLTEDENTQERSDGYPN